MSFLIMKTRAFRDIAPCSLVGIHRHFRDASCLHHQGDGGSTNLCNVGLFQLDYTAQYRRRPSSSYSPPLKPYISRINDDFKGQISFTSVFGYS
jgi:hypothetical protein